MSLHVRLILYISVILLINFFALEYYSYNNIQKQSEEDLLHRAENIHAMIMSIRRVYHKQFLESGIELTSKTVGFLPAHAMNRISRDLSNRDTSGFSFNNVSDRPRNPAQQADEFELKAMNYFRANRTEEVYFAPFINLEGKPFYLYARPVWVEEYCLKCHGKRGEAPQTIREMYDSSYDYKTGDLRGVMSIKMPTTLIKEKEREYFINSLLAHTLEFIILMTLVSLLIQRYVREPLNNLTDAMEFVSEGHYDKRISGLSGEFALLGDTFNAMAENITTHRTKLIESDEKARLLLESTGEAIFGIDLNGNCTFANSTCINMLGLKEEDLIGNNSHNIFHHSQADGSDYPEEKCRIYKVLENGEGVNVNDEVFWRSNNTCFPVAYRAYPVMDGGVIIGTVVTFLDISEKKRAEKRLKLEIGERNEAEQRLKLSQYYLSKAQELTKLGHWQLEIDSGKVEESSELYKIFEIDPDNSTFDAFVETVHPEDRDMDLEAIKRGIDHGEPWNIEHRLLFADGRIKWVQAIGEPVVDDIGKTRRLMGTIQDITARKTIEEELARYRESLEELVKVRTAKLESVNMELEAFSYSVSHDLRAPLRGLSGFSHALQEEYGDKLDEDGRDYLKYIQDSARQMGYLIDSLLKLSRITRKELNKKEVNLSDMVRQSFEKLTKSGPYTNVNIDIEQGLMVQADPILMDVVVQNLVENSLKFSAKRGYTMIRFGSFVEDDDTVYFVEDNGAGFNMNYENKLFAPFQRLHRVSEFEGAGIGLATVKRIISKHGGRIWAMGEVDKGATFYFTLTGRIQP